VNANRFLIELKGRNDHIRAALLLIRERRVHAGRRIVLAHLVNDYHEIAFGCVNLGSPRKNNSTPILDYARD
jgi:hypothetical protein